MDAVQPIPTAREDEAEELPQRSLLTVYEVLNWIAFQRPINGDLRGTAHFQKLWVVNAPPAPTAEFLLVTLRNIAFQREGWPAPEEASYIPTPSKKTQDRMLGIANERIASLKSSALELSELLEKHIRRYESQAAVVVSAQAALIDALAGRKLTAIASPRVEREAYPTRSSADAILVPSEYFVTPGVHFEAWSGRILAPDTRGYGGTRFRTEEVACVWPVQSDSAKPQTPPLTTNPEQHRAKGGRAESYDWKAFTREVVRFAHLDGFDTRRELMQHMEQWCTVNWPDPPSDRTLRDRIRELCPPEIPEK